MFSSSRIIDSDQVISQFRIVTSDDKLVVSLSSDWNTPEDCFLCAVERFVKGIGNPQDSRNLGPSTSTTPLDASHRSRRLLMAMTGTEFLQQNSLPLSVCSSLFLNK